jgi:nucleoside-diphosphate-sugar epimerase
MTFEGKDVAIGCKKVVVTGGSGRLGRFVLERLKDKHAITVIDMKPSDMAGVGFDNVNITDLAGLTKAIQRVDGVIHLVVVPIPGTSTQETCFRVNTRDAWAVLQAREDAGVKRVIVASRDSATGLHLNRVNWPPQYHPVHEKHPVQLGEVCSLPKEVTEWTFHLRGRRAATSRNTQCTIFASRERIAKKHTSPYMLITDQLSDV